MSTLTPPFADHQPDARSMAQKLNETNRILAETGLIYARQAKARAERRERFEARYPLFGRHDWLMPSIVAVGAICAGVALGIALVMLARSMAA